MAAELTLRDAKELEARREHAALSRALPRLTFAVSLVCLVSTLVAGRAPLSLVFVPAPLVTGLILLVLNVATYVVAYRAHPSVAERRTALASLHVAERAVASIDKAVKARDRDAENARSVLQRTTDQIQGALKHSPDQEAKDRTSSLAAAQNSYVTQVLRATPIAGAKIEGVGSGMAGRLVAHGIRTAADVYQSRVAGVPGFGPQRVSAVLAWRAAVEAYARNTAPRALSAAESQRITADHEARRQKLRSEQEQATTAYTQQVGVLDAARAELQQQRGQAEEHLERERTRATVYSSLSGWRYVAWLLGVGQFGQAPDPVAECENLLSECDSLVVDIEADIRFAATDSVGSVSSAYNSAIELRERGEQLFRQAPSVSDVMRARQLLDDARIGLVDVNERLGSRRPTPEK